MYYSCILYLIQKVKSISLLFLLNYILGWNINPDTIKKLQTVLNKGKHIIVYTKEKKCDIRVYLIGYIVSASYDVSIVIDVDEDFKMIPLTERGINVIYISPNERKNWNLAKCIVQKLEHYEKFAYTFLYTLKNKHILSNQLINSNINSHDRAASILARRARVDANIAQLYQIALNTKSDIYVIKFDFDNYDIALKRIMFEQRIDFAEHSTNIKSDDIFNNIDFENECQNINDQINSVLILNPIERKIQKVQNTRLISIINIKRSILKFVPCLIISYILLNMFFSFFY
jgi:hypothetical protein